MDIARIALAADENFVVHTSWVPRQVQGMRVIVCVSSLAELGDFARLSAANWSPPAVEVVHFYERAAPVLLRHDAPQRFYVGYFGGQPMATAGFTIGGGVAGLYNISTLPGHRRRGIGTAMTPRPLVDAREHGCPAAVLQAAPDGVGVYTRLGFEAFGPITEYKPARPAPT